MKFLVLCVSLFAFAGASELHCHDHVVASCRPGSNPSHDGCTSMYSAISRVTPELNNYIIHNIALNFDYLLMSVNFGNFEKNRDGFSKLYRKLSDSTWEDAINLIKYVTKRGETAKFDPAAFSEPNKVVTESYEMHELQSLGWALDMHKNLAMKAHSIHGDVTKHKDGYHDAETLSYLEEHFVHKHAETIRQLSGHVNDLKHLIKEAADPSLSIFLFDEYLTSSL